MYDDQLMGNAVNLTSSGTLVYIIDRKIAIILSMHIILATDL